MRAENRVYQVWMKKIFAPEFFQPQPQPTSAFDIPSSSPSLVLALKSPEPQPAQNHSGRLHSVKNPESLQSLKNPELLLELKTLVATETSTTAQIIALLEEVERRQLHLEQGYTSLFAFAVGYLKYSEPQAQRRISAMRIIRNEPELKAKVESGAIPLTTLNQAARFFNQGDFTPAEKKAVILELEGLSTREIQKKLHPGEQEYKFWADEELQEDLRRLRDLYPNEPGLAGLIQKAAKLAIQSHANQKPTRPMPARPDSRVPSPELRQRIIERDKSCTYLHEGKRCGSTFALEIDHIHPWTLGGQTLETNLRLLCRAHNRYVARKNGLEWAS